MAHSRLPLLITSLPVLALALNGCGDSGASDTGAGGSSGSTGDTSSSTGGPSGAPVEGDPCTEEGTLRCGSDATGSADNLALHCVDGVYENVHQCPGLQECTDISGYDQVQCGGSTYFAVNGGPCANDQSQVCTFDEEVVLKCDAGTWIEAVHCPPSNCEVVPDSDGNLCSGTWCGNCGYSIGDVCSFGAGSVNCTTDLSAVVQCASGEVVLYQDCAAAGQTCTWFTDNTIACQ